MHEYWLIFKLWTSYRTLNKIFHSLSLPVCGMGVILTYSTRISLHSISTQSSHIELQLKLTNETIIRMIWWVLFHNMLKNHRKLSFYWKYLCCSKSMCCFCFHLTRLSSSGWLLTEKIHTFFSGNLTLYLSSSLFSLTNFSCMFSCCI